LLAQGDELAEAALRPARQVATSVADGATAFRGYCVAEGYALFPDVKAMAFFGA